MRSRFGRLRSLEGGSEASPRCDLKSDRPAFPLVLHVPTPLPSGTENAWLSGSALLLTQLVCVLGQLAVGQGGRIRGVRRLSTRRYDFQGTSGCEGPGFGHFSFQNQHGMQPNSCEPAEPLSALTGVSDLWDKLRK